MPQVTMQKTLSSSGSKPLSALEELGEHKRAEELIRVLVLRLYNNEYMRVGTYRPEKGEPFA